jgi:GWxTD domain-containing protein
MQNLRTIKYILLLIICLLYTDSLFSQRMGQGRNMEGSKQVFGPSLFSYETYLFKSSNEENKSRLDVYVAFANDILQFVKERQGNYSSNYELLVTVFDKKGNLIGEQSETNDVLAKNFAFTNDRRLSNRHNFSFDLNPAPYKLVINLTDNDTQQTLKREKKIEIKRFSFNKALLSEVVFADKIRTNQNGKIEKILPNLTRKFVNPDSSFWVQFELYPKNFTDSLNLEYSIIDMNSHTVVRKAFSFLPNTKIIRYLIDLGKHVKISGRYFLILQVNQNENQTKKRVKFSANWNNEEFSKVNIDVAIKTMKDFLPSGDFKQIKNAPDSVKKEYFKKFWKQRDPTPNTENNELLDEFYSRVNFSNNYFSVNMLDLEGWNTDRGALYIKYGPPTEVERHLDEINLPPYEIWVYDKHQRRYFFEDRGGRGEFKLVRME